MAMWDLNHCSNRLLMTADETIKTIEKGDRLPHRFLAHCVNQTINLYCEMMLPECKWDNMQ